MRPASLLVLPLDGLGEVRAGDDLAGLLAGRADLRDGDVLVVTSKVVSKAEGRTVTGSREELLAAETDRVVARRGPTSIVRTRHGLVMAAAGIDASNVEAGAVVLLPVDPDASARRLREDLAVSTGRNLAVLVTDTSGRAWRAGQTDLAIGAAGLEVLHDYTGRSDPHGNTLAVTAPAVADELAAAADLVKRKLDRRPAAVVRGLPELVLPPGEHGPGAAALVRPEADDLFGLGAREAVLAALGGEQARGFGSPCGRSELLERLQGLAGDLAVLAPDGPGVVAQLAGSRDVRPATRVRLEVAAFALGWSTTTAAATGESANLLRFAPRTP